MNEIRSNGSGKGCRAMYQALTRKGIAVDKDSVRLVLKELDPERVAQWSRHKLGRRKYYAKGPSSIWHLDGNDKGNRMDSVYMDVLINLAGTCCD